MRSSRRPSERDPPYVHSSRGDASAYGYEMTDADHEDLAELLHRIRGCAVGSVIDPEPAGGHGFANRVHRRANERRVGPTFICCRQGVCRPAGGRTLAHRIQAGTLGAHGASRKCDKKEYGSHKGQRYFQNLEYGRSIPGLFLGIPFVTKFFQLGFAGFEIRRVAVQFHGFSV